MRAGVFPGTPFAEFFKEFFDRKRLKVPH